MDRNFNTEPSKDGIGYLVVRVSTALGAIPLSDATVNIRGNTKENSGVIYSLISDRDGLTEKVELPAPPRTLADTPGNAPPYSTWNIDVFLDGYVPVLFTGVPVYSSTVSVQPAVLVSLGERYTDRQTYGETTAPTL